MLLASEPKQIANLANSRLQRLVGGEAKIHWGVKIGVGNHPNLKGSVQEVSYQVRGGFGWLHLRLSAQSLYRPSSGSWGKMNMIGVNLPVEELHEVCYGLLQFRGGENIAVTLIPAGGSICDDGTYLT